MEAIAYDERGLVPCVIQDCPHRRGADAGLHERRGARRRTQETGELHLWSRSRDELWHKGATSGNTQAVRALRYDCDADAILALVDPAGPACHTGERTCFLRGDSTPAAARGAARPRAHDRRARRRRGRRGLLHRRAARRPGVHRARRSQEEAEEVARAAREESDERVAEEAADVLYHLTVLLRTRGLELADAERVLLDRRR